MSVVLDERCFAEQKLRYPELGHRPGETLGRIAKYYYASGYTKKDTISRLKDYLIRCDPRINLVRWDSLIKSAADYAEKRDLIEIDSIPITQNELSTISTLSSRPLRRLLFTLICLAKFGNTVNPNNKSWVNVRCKEIFSMANVQCNNERQGLLLGNLLSLGLIGCSHVVDNTNVYVKCLSDDSEVVLRITDFRNLGYQYLKFLGEPYVNCDRCGLTIKRTGRRQKYCCSCAESINLEKTKERWMDKKAYYLS